MADEILRDPRISGQHDRASSIIDPIAKRRMYWSVIHLKCSDLYAILLQRDSLADVLGQDDRTLRHRSIDIGANPEVVVKRLLEKRHHFHRPSGPSHRERNVAAWPHEPACQPEIGEANNVVGVQVREEHSLYILPSRLDLVEPLHGAATCVEEVFLSARFHESTWSEASYVRGGRTRAQEGHLDFLPVGGGRSVRRGE